MTDQELERRLRAWYRAQMDEGEGSPIGLRTRLASLPETHPIARRWPVSANWRSLVMNRLVPIGLGAAAVVIAVVLGVALFSRSPSEIGGPSPVPSPTASTASPVSGWRMVQEFVPPPSISIASVTARGAGFVAVGTDEVLLQDGCFGSHREGVVLSSTDGEQWTRVVDEAFAHAQLEHVVDTGGDLYILGHVFPIAVALEDPPGACGTPPPNLGFNVWRSIDNGSSWERLAQPSNMQDAVIWEVVSVDGVLVAAGNRTTPQTPELVSPAVWTSPDGIEWRIADTLPQATSFSLARSGRVIVAAGNEDSPLAYSEDGARNWHEAAVAPYPAISQWIVAARDGRFVAVGYSEEISDDYSMTVLTSEDGKVWTEAPSLQLGSSIMNGLVALPDYFLGIGVELAAEGGGRRYIGMRGWVSADGIDWLPAPAFPTEGIVNANAVAAGPNGIVVATTSRDALWFAPLSTFE